MFALKSYSPCVRKTLNEYERACKHKGSEVKVTYYIKCKGLGYKYDVANGVIMDVSDTVFEWYKKEYDAEKTCRDNNEIRLTKIRSKR